MATRIAGRRGRIYLGLASDTAAAEPLPFVANWSIDFAVDKLDVTAMGDANKVKLADLADVSGDFSGFYDQDTNQHYTAATDGLARRMYIYPDISKSPAQYFWGTAIVDFHAEGGVGAGVAVSGSWEAASAWAKVG